MHTFKIHMMKKVWKKRIQINPSHMTPSHHAKHPMNVFCHFFGLGVRLRTTLLHFLVLRKIFPGGSYKEVFLKWVLWVLWLSLPRRGSKKGWVL